MDEDIIARIKSTEQSANKAIEMLRCAVLELVTEQLTILADTYIRLFGDTPEPFNSLEAVARYVGTWRNYRDTEAAYQSFINLVWYPSIVAEAWCIYTVKTVHNS